MPDSETPPRLTTKQQRFIDAYLGECKGNASAAALQAGYRVRESAWDILSNPRIRARIDDQLRAESLTSAEVLHHLSDVARAEWREFLHLTINPKNGEVLDVKMDLGSKVRALELLGKFHKLFTDKTENSTTVLVREYADAD